jgi:hypothetical protein
MVQPLKISWKFVISEKKRSAITMKQSAILMIYPCSFNGLPVKTVRLILGTILLTGLVACAGVPSDPAESIEVAEQAPEMGMASVSVMYNTGDIAGTMAGFDDIIGSSDSDADSRRLAHLGKALIYLGSDKSWHSIDNARVSLSAAGSIVPEDNEEFDIETDMLMDSVTAQIGSESKYQELKAKTGRSRAEITKLQKERDTLVKERDELLKEQQTLNEALEKLKNLTLGN